MKVEACHQGACLSLRVKMQMSIDLVLFLFTARSSWFGASSVVLQSHLGYGNLSYVVVSRVNIDHVAVNPVSDCGSRNWAAFARAPNPGEWLGSERARPRARLFGSGFGRWESRSGSLMNSQRASSFVSVDIDSQFEIGLNCDFDD